MLLSTVLAIIPMSAAEAEKTNVLFSDADAANYQFAGKGNVFYYDYHYYVDTLNTFPMSNKGPSLRVGNNSGSGTASATDGKPFAGSMNHSYSDDCAELTLADGSTVKHDHVFGYSFKESVTIDSFKLYVTAGNDGRDDINKVTVYGASVDPAIKYDSYEAGKYYYSTVTELYKMADNADVQANKQTEGDVTAAVVSGDFVAPATVDYILFAVDFNTINAKKYTVLEAEAYGVIAEPEAPEVPEVPEEEEEEVAIDDLLPFVDTKAVDFAGLDYKSLFAGAESTDKFEEVYDVIIDGNALSAPAKETTNNDKNYNLGYVGQTEYAITADSYYVYEFKAKLNRSTGYAGVVFAANGTEHYFVGSAFANDGDHKINDVRASHSQIFKNEWSGNLNDEFGDHTKVPVLVEEGYGTWRVIYDGLTVYVQYVDAEGNWAYVGGEEPASVVLPEGFYVAFGAHNRGGNLEKQRTINIKDARFYDLNTPTVDALMMLAEEEDVDFANLVFRTLYDGKVSDKNFEEEYTVTKDGNDLNTVANDKTSGTKGDNLGYVAQTEYAITADSYYVYELKAKLNRNTGYAGFVFAVNGDEHYFAGGAFANDGDHDDDEGNQASHLVLYKGKWDTTFNKQFGDHTAIPVLVEDGYGSWRIVYEGLTVKVQYLAKDGNWEYVMFNGEVASITLPEGSYVAVGAHNRGGKPDGQRVINIKDAVIYDLNSKALDKLVEYAAEEDVDFANLVYKTLIGGAVSDKVFTNEYDVTADGNSLTTAAKDTTSNTTGDDLGYVAQTEYAITADSYYVYEFKAKLNRNTGYAGVVFAVNGDEHYFVGGAFANDGDHNDPEGNQAAHIRIYEGEWESPVDSYGDHYKFSTLVEEGFGTWRIVYDGLTVYVQYLAKDGTWAYVTDIKTGEVPSYTLKEGSYVAFGAHNRGGNSSKQRTISIKDAVLYDLNKINLNKGVGPALSTPEEFVEALAQGGDFYLLNDIVLPENYVPADFTGSIDGQGFAITLAGSKGLFATLTDASISNLTIKGKTAAEGSYGVLADKAAGKVNVTNVTVDVEEVKGSEVAGFIRLTNVKGSEVAFTNCKNLAPITGTGKAAGFVAYSNESKLTFKNCQNLVSVNGGNDTAGFVADFENGDLVIEESVNGILGETSVEGLNACGGFVGEGSANVTVINSTNYSLIFDNGTSDWDSTAGGIVGMFANRGDVSVFTAKGVKNFGDLKTRDQWYQGAGGIVGSAKWKDTTRLYFEDTINYGSCVKTGTGPNLGGFVGYTDNGNLVEFIFKNCQNYGDFRSNGNNSGFVGQAGSLNTYFENCQNYGDIRSHNNMAGGFVAWQKHTKITLKDCANYGTITANSKYAAGLVSGPNCADVTLDNCANYGRLIGAQRAVGLVYAEGGTVANSANYGALSVTNADGKTYAFGNSKITVDEATCKDEGVYGYKEVSNADEFMAMQAGGLYVLTTDIVLPTGYTAIDFGAEWYQAELNGNGYTVTLKSDNGASIFNNLASAKIYNVNFKGNSEFAAESGFVAAKVVGAAKVSFENVNVEAYLTSSANVGGYVGTTDAELVSLTFKNCTFEGSVVSTAYAGGFTGQINANQSTISFENCVVGSKNEQTVVAGATRVAGFVAKTLAKDNTSSIALTFKNCANYADLTSVGTGKAAVGSLVGRVNRVNLVVDGCANYGDITNNATSSSNGTGGLIGEAIYNCKVNVTASKNYGDINTVTSMPGGLIGLIAYRSYVTVGALNADGTVNEAKACANYGDINQADGWACGSGGIIGHIKSNSLKDLMTADSTPNEIRVYGAANYGDITTALSNIGGIVGMTDDNANNVALLEIVGCTNNGDLLATGGNNVGGITGQTPGTVVKIINCVNNGYVRSINNECGGIYGRTYAGKGELTIDGCVNNGRVEATKWAGGIASGLQEVGTANVTNCVNNGIVVTTMNTEGGVAAIVSCINNGVVSGCTNNGIAAAVTAKQIVRDNWGGGKVENNVENGAAVSGADLIVKAQALYGVADYADAAVYAEVVKAFAAAQAVIDRTLVFTHADFVAAEGKSGYAAFAGEHVVGDITATLADVMTSNNQTGGIDVLQLKKQSGTLTFKNVAIEKLAIRVVSSYDYTANVTISVGDTVLTLADPADIAAAKVYTGVDTSKGYALNYFDIIVDLDAPLAGDLVIKNTTGYAVYFESVAFLPVEAAAPAPAAEEALDLDALIGKLVNVKALKEAILDVEVNAAKGYADEDYTADTVAALNAALEAAKNAKTQAEVDAAVESINKAQDAVVYVGALNHQIAAAEALEKVNYTKSTWEVLEDALAAAKAVDLKDQAAIDAATAALADAIYNLGDIKAVADLTKKTIAKAEALIEADYTVASWAPMAAAIAAAKASLDSGDADVMDAAVVALEEVIAKLVRTAELQAAIAGVADLVADNYTTSSWSAFAVALDAAKAALVATNNTAVEKALANLEAAKAALVETADLQAAIADVEALNSADYTAESWADVASALASAKLALLAGNADSVKAAADALAAAKAALVAYVAVDTSALESAIADAETLVAGDYTADTWAAFTAALSAAKAALYGEQADVDAAVAALAAAKAALAAKPDVTALEAAIAEIKALVKADYTSASWTALETALAAAKAALKADAQADVDAAVAALAAAKAALAEMPDTAALEAAIAEIKALYATDYTAETWAALADALAAAKAALKAEAQADVDAAVAALAAAKAALEEKPAPVVPEDPGETEPVQKPTEKPTEPVDDDGCGGVIGAAAVVITAVLGLGVTVLKKKD